LKIIDRYILRAISAPFFTSLGIMTFVLLLGKILQLMDLMVNKGVTVIAIASLIFYLMPYFLLFTIPISLLLAILTGLGRLSADNEITVLKGSGLSLYRLLYPLALASGLAFLISLSLSFFFVPASNYATKNLLFNVVRQNASVGIKEKVFNDNFRGLLLYANHIPAHGKYMEGVIISDNRISKEPSTIFADKAYLISDPESLLVGLRLEVGSTHVIDMKRKSYSRMDFSSYDINLDLESSLIETEKKAAKGGKEMTPAELIAEIGAPGGKEAAKRALAVELNKKFTMPLTCLIFGLLGLPIGIKVRKSAKAWGFTMGLIIVLLYYLLQLFGTAFTETGKISVWLGLWFPNFLFTIAGLYLLLTAAQEKGTIIDDIQGRLSNLRQRFRRSK
jgi:lipopolysaccharide export system permease protein